MDFINAKLNFSNVTMAKAVLACFFMASFYVISLYLWSKQNRYNRNEPSVIKRRFISVAISCLVSLLTVYLIADKPMESELVQFEKSFPIYEWLGFRTGILIRSCTTSLLITMLLFSGPLVQYFISDYLLTQKFRAYEEYNNQKDKKTSFDWFKKQITQFQEFGKENVYDLCFWRNYIISPFTEEFVFRSSMLPLLAPHLSFNALILTTPLFFGLAHLHHIIEGYFANDQPLKSLVTQHLFQFTYTYIFGIYSSYLFLRTGSFYSCLISHSFCNFMGFPNLLQLLNDFSRRMKVGILCTYVTGLVMFFLFLATVSEPSLFDNRVFIWY